MEHGLVLLYIGSQLCISPKCWHCLKYRSLKKKYRAVPLPQKMLIFIYPPVFFSSLGFTE